LNPEDCGFRKCLARAPARENISAAARNPANQRDFSASSARCPKRGDGFPSRVRMPHSRWNDLPPVIANWLTFMAMQQSGHRKPVAGAALMQTVA
jgi:hypothetical protein